MYNPGTPGLDQVSTGSIRKASSGTEQPLAQNTWNIFCDCQEGTGKGGRKWWKEMCIRAYLWDFQHSTQDTFCALSSIPNSKYEICYFKPAISDIKPLAQQHHKEGCTELTLKLAFFSTYPTGLKLTLLWLKPRMQCGQTAISTQAGTWFQWNLHSSKQQPLNSNKAQASTKLSRSFGTLGSWRRNLGRVLWAVYSSLCPEHRKVRRVSPRTDGGSKYKLAN